MAQEKGFCSVVLMILTGTAMVIGSFFILFAKNELITAERFYEGIAAENLAQAGICDVLVKLSKNIPFKREMPEWGECESVFVSDNRIKKGGYTVYLTYKNQLPLLLSIGAYRGAKRQDVVYLSVETDGQLTITSRRNQ